MFSPCEFFREEQEKIVPKDKIRMIRPKLEGLHCTVDKLRNLLAEIEDTVRRSVAPGLNPSTRRKIALETAQKLDAFHKENRAIAFVGQSYAAATGEAFALYRFMEQQEELEAWSSAWSELIEGHRSLLDFCDRWFHYAILAADWYASFPDSTTFLDAIAPCSEEKSLELARKYFDFSETKSFEEKEIPEVTSFLSRTDASQQHWDLPLQLEGCVVF